MLKRPIFPDIHVTKESTIRIWVTPAELREAANYLEQEMAGIEVGATLPYVEISYSGDNLQSKTVILSHRQ